jgi:hypothetical protein
VLPQLDLSNCAVRRRRSCHDVGRGETVRFTTSVSVCRMPRMSTLKLVLWGFLAVLGSVALAFVVGFVNPQEEVNGLWLVVAAAG